MRQHAPGQGAPRAPSPEGAPQTPWPEGARAPRAPAPAPGVPAAEPSAPAAGPGPARAAPEAPAAGAAASAGPGAPAARDEGAAEAGSATGRGPVPVLERAVREVMRTSLVTVAAGETVLTAWELLERSGARHLPVVLPDGRCAGLLDRAEVAVACAAPAVSLSRRYAWDLVRCRRCVVVHHGDPVGRAVAVMDANGCDALPVVGDAGTLAGLFTAADVVAALAGRRAEVLPGVGARPPYPYPVMPGLPPRQDDGRISPVP
ncbi:CBS domain-containing protein [Streptomyces sp. enrichment culture]|uniref:CBS domain-containing protein n=1 Tax=Streptomyces sp. enrichment culture TaxID=1795815 RepID=UPI003F565643